ncbi:trk system potassium uptake protein TrkA [Lachnospiraceae bacterium KH1T2]|nr:trk system potassium uptake protein TrkA [Lachnospiraceae bacterium KH1T2]
MNILVAGIGKVGMTLVRQLSAEGHDLTVIDYSSGVLENCVEDYDVMAIEGNCATMETLEEAGVENADLLLAMTNADEVNLLCCMTAHHMNSKLHTIARIRDPEYTQQAYTMRGAFALSMVVNPDRSAAREINRLIKYPGFLKRDTFAKGLAEIVELKVDEKSALKDLSLFQLNSTVKAQILVCTVLREGNAIIPSGDFSLRQGDRVFVTGSAKDLAVMLRNLGIITHKARRVLIAGGGRISYYLAKTLLEQGTAVQIIERDEKRCHNLAEALPDASIIHGDVSNQYILNREGLEGCDSFVTATGVDETNIVMSLYAAKKNVPQIITKLGRAENMEIINELSVGSLVCPKELCAASVVRYVRAMKNQVGAAVTMHTIADGQAEALEFVVDENTRHCNEQLKNIKLKDNVLLAGITHKGRTIIPRGDSYFVPGDSLVVVESGQGTVLRLNDIFES